jgi:hypothetical protein
LKVESGENRIENGKLKVGKARGIGCKEKCGMGNKGEIGIWNWEFGIGN